MHLVSGCHYWGLAFTSPLIRAAEVLVGEKPERNSFTYKSLQLVKMWGEEVEAIESWEEKDLLYIKKDY